MKPQDEKSQATIDQQPLKLAPRHRALMRRLVGGAKLQDVCEDLGFTVVRASVIVNTPLFQEEMERMEKGIDREFVDAEANKASDATRKVLYEASEKAARTLDGALNDESVQARVSAAKDILDRTGYAKEDKIKAEVLVEPSQSLLDVVARIVREKNATRTSEPGKD